MTENKETDMKDNTEPVVENAETPVVSREDLIKSRREYFAEVSNDAAVEFDDMCPCTRCKFLSQTCHKTCGIIMKHVAKMRDYGV